MMRFFICAAFLCCFAALANAEPVSPEEIAAQLAPTEQVGLRVANDLSDQDHTTVKVLLPLMEQQMGTKAKFFGALAFSPDDGLASRSLQGAFNFHSVEAADSAALAACTGEKSTNAGACRIAARIVPVGYEPGGVTLSYDATQAFVARFLPAPGDKFFAISGATGAYGMAPSERGALWSCSQSARGRDDCRVISKN